MENIKVNQNGKSVLLINISLRPNSKVTWFPIGIGYIATSMKNSGINFDLLDIEAYRYSNEEIIQKFADKKYDIYCLGTLVTGYSKMKWLAEEIRKSNAEATIICGNSVVSSIPKITLKKTEVDIGVTGEGDVTIVELIDAICNNKPISEVAGICYLNGNEVVLTQRRPVIEDIDSLPIIDWEIFNIDLYLEKSINGIAKPYPIPKEQIKAFVINTARGCPFQCTFCFHVFKGYKYRYRSSASIVFELKMLNQRYGINYVNFLDELTFFSKQQAEEFADKLIASGLNIFWNADIRSNLFTDADAEILQKMKQSGCLSVGYSLESGNAEILRQMNKGLSVDDFITQKRALSAAGIHSNTSLVFGYPTETKETIRETFRALEKAGVYPSSGYLLPQPGTPMYDLALERGIIKNEEEYLLKMGDRQDFMVNFTNMSDEEFQAEVKEQLVILNEKLKMNLDQENLIKTGNQLQQI